ncbi:membrane lipoprotein lipid attachment site-containing protein [Paenibacillus sp. 19GGS1-52]|uniref:membrane lipoprotein lipid attachment site-containing protein n=1 Tax=Paenibacillus sp. 19GGS1-52 TaxID=2758563 RepID=UPI001EFAAA95|nr:membrane lipoprotein lipid attachment site-containing protein [Paenibacillus sp. 19GGS1-52]ULO09592.1 membrane lipoprotein lipid attachment site-containing protein [Paenibacillus sp. 19GGS1-52]
MKKFLVIFLFVLFLSGCVTRESSNSETEKIVDDPVTWLNIEGKKYYYFSSQPVALEENTLVDTGIITDSDDGISDVGLKIYKSDDFTDSFFIKNPGDGVWLEYRYRK